MKDSAFRFLLDIEILLECGFSLKRYISRKIIVCSFPYFTVQLLIEMMLQKVVLILSPMDQTDKLGLLVDKRIQVLLQNDNDTLMLMFGNVDEF